MAALPPRGYVNDWVYTTSVADLQDLKARFNEAVESVTAKYLIKFLQEFNSYTLRQEY